MDNLYIAPLYVNYRPLRLVPPTPVANQPAENNDAQGIDEEIIAPVISQLPDHVLLQIFTWVPVRGIIRATAVSHRFNNLLADTELPPRAYLASESSPWFFFECTLLHPAPRGMLRKDYDVSLGYDPVSDKWRRFLVIFSRKERFRIWTQISSADGLVCAAYLYHGHDVSLQVLDPYTVRSRFLPQFPNHFITAQGLYDRRGVLRFCTNIWMIDPAECRYKIIVSRSRMAVGRPLPAGVEFLVVFYIDSYDKISNTWRTEFWVELPNDCIITGSSTICRNILYNIMQSKSLERLHAADDNSRTQYFLHQYDLARNEIVLPQLIALPCSFCSRPSPVLVNCNDELILVGFKGRGVDVRAIVIWKFNSRTQTRYKWTELGVMPPEYFPSRFYQFVKCTGGGNLIYFSNITQVVVVDVSQIDNGRLQREAWKEVSPFPTRHVLVRHHFCYEPRLFHGTDL